MNIDEIKQKVLERRNELGQCPVCNSNIKDRTVTIYAGLIHSLYKVYVYCGEKRKHTFEMKEIKHFLDHNDYSRFNNLVRFGGIIYRPKDDDGDKKDGYYGINMGRAKAFFAGQYKIPVQIVLNQITNERIAATYTTIHEIPELYRLLNQQGLYDYEKVLHVKVDYREQKPDDLPSVEEYVGTNNLF